eukprot:g8706.t1
MSSDDFGWGRGRDGGGGGYSGGGERRRRSGGGGAATRLLSSPACPKVQGVTAEKLDSALESYWGNGKAADAEGENGTPAAMEEGQDGEVPASDAAAGNGEAGAGKSGN